MFGVAAALGVAASNQRAYVAEVEAAARRVRAHARGRGAPAGRRRAASDRARTARHHRPLALDHRGTGRRRRAGPSARPRLGSPRPGHHPRDREPLARRAPIARRRPPRCRGRHLGGRAAPREPQPSLLGLPDLVRSVEDSGIKVDLQVAESLGRAARVRRSLGVPDRSGGADQRGPPRGTRPRCRMSIARENGSLLDRRGGQRPTAPRASRRTRARHQRDARTGRRAGRHVRGRASARGGFRVFARIPVTRRGSGRE